MNLVNIYKVGDQLYEIADDAARKDISVLQADLNDTKENVDELQDIFEKHESDIEKLKLSSISPDTSLGIQGAAADSKAVGDAINQLRADTSNMIDAITTESIGAVNVNKIANNITTVEEGYVLDARQAYELNRLIQQRATTASYTATFPVSGWSSSSPYTQTVNVSGILSTDNPIVDIDMSNAQNADDWAALIESWNFVGRITANQGSVTMYCYDDKPTVNITIFLKVVR